MINNFIVWLREAAHGKSNVILLENSGHDLLLLVSLNYSAVRRAECCVEIHTHAGTQRLYDYAFVQQFGLVTSH